MDSWRGTTVAVTGATGFVGHHVALELKRHGADVLAVTRPTSNVERLRLAGVRKEIASLDDVDALTRALEGCNIVVHVAGAVGFENAWEEYQRVNVAGTRNLLAAARRAGVRRFLHTSSIVAVGASDTAIALTEHATWNLAERNVPYVTTKRLAEKAALEANGNELEVIVVNPGCVIGPDDFSGSEFGILCNRFWKGRLRVYFSGGNNLADVRDVATGIRLAIEKGRPGQRYLLTGENRTYAAFFGDLARAAGRSIPCMRLPLAAARFLGWLDAKLRRDSRRPYLSASQAALMGLYFFFDAQKAREELGFSTRPLNESLADAHAFWMSSDRAAA